MNSKQPLVTEPLGNIAAINDKCKPWKKGGLCINAGSRPEMSNFRVNTIRKHLKQNKYSQEFWILFLWLCCCQVAYDRANNLAQRINTEP